MSGISKDFESGAEVQSFLLPPPVNWNYALDYIVSV